MTAPILRAGRREDPPDAIKDPAGLGAVLACGTCDLAVEDFDHEGGWMSEPIALPCRHPVVDVPTWAMNQLRGGR